MLFVWLLLLVALSLAPIKVKLLLGTMGRFHSAGHLLVFGMTTYLCLGKARSAGSRITYAILLLALSAFLEFVEMILYHNPFEWRDVGLDALAISAVLAGFLAITAPKPSSTVQRP